MQRIVGDDPRPGKWILTGSQNLALIASVSQSLAGRTALLHLLPLARSEVLRFGHHPQKLEETVLAGGYPRIFDRKLAPSEWLSSYASTYVERDVRSVANMGDLGTFRRFLGLCAGRTGQLLLDPTEYSGIPHRVFGYPAAVVIDRQGKVRWRGHPAFLMRPLIDKVIAEK